MKKVAIIGTQGVPAKYGGFETLVEYLVRNLNKKNRFTVYCSRENHTERKKKKYNGAVLKFIPLRANGLQSIPYDIISLFHASVKNDTILILGVSGCIILPVFRLLYPHKKLIINIDGNESGRKKWNRFVRLFLKTSEKLAIRYANVIIADNKAVREYILNNYQKKSIFIPYGGNQVKKLHLSETIKKKYRLPEKFACKICRIEPENRLVSSQVSSFG